MAFTYSPKIVTDGLIFNIDAANPRSYVSGNTDVFSLEGTYSGDLFNGTFSNSSSGCWELDGVNDYLDFSQASTGVFTSSFDPQLDSFTVNCFFEIDSNTSNTGMIIGKGARGSGNIGWSIWYSPASEKVYVRCNGNDTVSQRAGQNIPINEDQIYMVTLVIDRTNNVILGYLDGSNNNWIDGGGGGPLDNDITGFNSILIEKKLLIGTRSDLSLDMYGNFYLAQIYNRALTSTEVQQNYNALKHRFQ